MRELTDHIVSGDQAVQLKINVTDGPGAGGACHWYDISGFDSTGNASVVGTPFEGEKILRVLFQNGPITESGVNGVTQEALAAIVIDRLRSFQAGPFAGDYNARALESFEQGLKWLQQRTLDRIARNVEGTHNA